MSDPQAEQLDIQAALAELRNLDTVFELVREENNAFAGRFDALNTQTATLLTMSGLLVSLLGIWKPPSVSLNLSSPANFMTSVLSLAALLLFFIGLAASLTALRRFSFQGLSPSTLTRKYISGADKVTKAAALSTLLDLHDYNERALRIKARWATITRWVLALEALVIGILVAWTLFS